MDSATLKGFGEFMQSLSRFIEYLRSSLEERSDVVAISSLEVSLEGGTFWVGFRIKRAVFRAVFQIAVGIRAGSIYALGDSDLPIWIEQLDHDEELWDRLTKTINGVAVLDDDMPFRGVGIEWNIPCSEDLSAIRNFAEDLSRKLLALFGVEETN